MTLKLYSLLFFIAVVKDEGRGESGNDSEQEEQIQEESQLEENQSGDQKDHNKTNDHFHASSIMEPTDSENKAPVTTQGDSSQKIQSATEGKEEPENNSKLIIVLLFTIEFWQIKILYACSRLEQRE